MRIGVALVVFAAACGPKIHVDDRAFDVDDPRAGKAIDEPKPISYDQLPIAPVTAAARTGTIDRAVLDAALDAGPGVLLGHLEVTAETDGDRFLGWRILGFDPQHKDFAGVDLAPGDVVVAIEGSPVARPDELEAVWQALRKADHIVVEVRRGDARFELDWTIAPPPGATPAPTPPK